MVKVSSFRRSLSSTIAVVFLSSTIGISVAEAANRFWIGSKTASNQYENPINWSTSMGGAGGQDAPTAADDAFFMNNLSGSSLLGKNAWIKSRAIMNGLVINQNMTGTIILGGTGSLNFGSKGIRMGSGRLIGGTGNISGSGSFTQSGGIVRMGPGNLYLSGSLAISKGAGSSYTEFVSTGTLVFNSRIADQNFTVGATVNNTSFKNLTLNNTAGGTADDIIASGTPLKLSGALLITQGNLDLDTSNVALQVESGVTLAANAQATLTSDANITASGHIVAGAGAAFVLSSNTFTLNGKNQN
ncbi:MAG: hypothetical protein V1876_01355, partial [Candidatus Peregrinibacteria bacterium]